MPAVITPACLEFARRASRRVRYRPQWVDADDVIQDCVVLYLELSPRYPEACGVSREVWLWYKVIDTLRAKYTREMKGDVTCDVADCAPAAAPDRSIDAHMDRQACEQMAGLNESECAVLTLRYDDGLTQEAIARHLDVSQPRVSQVLASAHAKIRSFYAESGLRSNSLVAV